MNDLRYHSTRTCPISVFPIAKKNHTHQPLRTTTRSPLVPVHHQPLHAPTKQAPLPRQQRASRVALALRDSGHPSSKPETALAVARILDPRERHPDARAVADALVDEVDVRRERRVHRGGERGEERRVDEAPLEAPPSRGERRGLVDLLLTPRGVRLC